LGGGLRSIHYEEVSDNKDYRRDIRKEESREPEKQPEPRVEAKDFRFWAFPRRERKFTGSEPVVDRTPEKV
jgi:hypothetical protein